MTGSQLGTPSPLRAVAARTKDVSAPGTLLEGAACEDDTKDKTRPAPAPTRATEEAATSGPLWSSSSHPWLVISLCDGIGGIFICLTLLGLPFSGIAAEIDHDLRDFTHRKFPQLTLFSDCTSVTLDVILKQFRSRQHGGIFLVGGPPCQPFSAAGKKRGFDDVRAAPCSYFCTLKRQLTDASVQHSFSFRCILEQVATMPPAHRQAIAEQFGEQPVLIQAADFGWVQRARLYWGVVGPLSSTKPTADWEFLQPGKVIDEVGVLRWCGGTCPEHWTPRKGWQWADGATESSCSVPIPGQQWRAAYKGGRFATFTTVYPHPPDHGAKGADEAQRQRFFADGQRFPLNTYAARNCVERDGELRVLDAEERERLMGYPPNTLKGLQMRQRNSEDTRCHAVGNGFHLPSVMLLIAVIFGLPQAVASSAIPASAWPLHHITGTTFDAKCGKLSSHATSPSALMADVVDMFPPDFFPAKRLHRAEQRLAAVDWRRLAHWRAWADEHHPMADISGPDTDAVRNRIGIYTATGRQRNVAGSKHTPATRLPSDLSAEEHMQAALSLQHPFELPALVELDVEFAVDACARLGPGASSWRYQVFDSIRKLARAVAPLDAWALQHRPTRHCDGWSPVLTAAFVHLIGWRDRGLPWALVAGFQVVGAIPTSGIHRQLEPDSGDQVNAQVPLDNDALRASLLGSKAAQYVDQLEGQLRPHEFAQEILEATLAEIELGLARPLETREQVDLVFGRGNWRPLPRHVIFQHGNTGQ